MNGQQIRRQALSDLLVLTGLCLIGMMVFSAAGLFLVSYLFNIEALSLANLGNPDTSLPSLRNAVLTLQGLISLGSFVFMPLLIRYLRPDQNSANGISLKPSVTMLVLIGGLGVLMMRLSHVALRRLIILTL